MSMATRNRPPLYERIEDAVFATASVIGQGLLLTTTPKARSVSATHTLTAA